MSNRPPALLCILGLLLVVMAADVGSAEPAAPPIIATANEVPQVGCGCFDDYCRKCWEPRCDALPAFYRCVSAGECGCHAQVRKQTWSWWFLPNPAAVFETIRWNR